ncbi:MAG: hypothetical protein A2Y40_02560 [Candidatus Margulisbacteria bacterium GWF2_35_9]|nr:MAG: hypothetical protein A2Y40_02560 [Candidatus Margulisbacteria bacterium GWF2_35_9]
MKTIKFILCLGLVISTFILAEVSINNPNDIDLMNDEINSAEEIIHFPESQNPVKQRYMHPKLRCVIEAPVSWNMDTTSASYKVLFRPQGESDEVYVGLIAYISREPVTANGMYLRRSGSKWDRWHLLGKKVLDEKDNFLIATDESIQALYSQSTMDKNLRITEIYVAENLYIKNETEVFIVTAVANKEKWFKYKDGIKSIMKSFYISE